jgi:hypothetical protein
LHLGARTTVTAVTADDEPAAVILTVELLDLVGSATLVAVTTSFPAFEGAVYWPAEVIVPRFALHVTFVFVVVPCTVA